MRIVFSLIFILLQSVCQAQLHNVWMLRGGGIDFNTNPSSGITKPNINPYPFAYSSICDSGGKLLFYTNGREVYNGMHKEFEPGFTLAGSATYFSDYNDVICTLILPIPGDSKKYYIFHITPDKLGASLRRLYYTIINLEGNNGKGVIEVKNVEILKDKINWVAAIKQENNKDFWIITYALTDTFYSFPITEAGIGSKVQSISSQIINPSNTFNTSVLRPSFDGKALLNTYYNYIPDSVNINDIYSIEYSNVCIYDFDKKSGVVSNKKIIIEKKLSNVYIKDNERRIFEDATFSPNDSLIYVCNSVGQKETNLYQIERFATDPSKTVTVIPYTIPINSVQTAPDGYIYLSNSNSFDIIKHPNWKGTACKVDSHYIGNRYNHYKFPSIFLELHQLGFIFHPCKDSFSLAVTTDTAYFKNYSWFFSNGDSISGENIIYGFKGKSGKYQVILRGKNKHGASNWYKDSILYIAPPKAKYVAESKVGCQWVGYQFTNLSISDTIHPINKSTYLWDFGDGTTDTAKNPHHIFRKHGSYKVTLIYNNGFCADSFTQQQDVKILEAPKPGFTVSDTLGCLPFTVIITDNSLGSVVNYSYSLGKEFYANTANTSYTFTKPGIYYITQKLLGPTGCITSDSISVRVRAGILPDEKPVMLRATFLSNHRVEISWKKHPLAKHYDLYKQHSKNTFELIGKNLTDTIFADNSISLSQSFHYYITATDSCGNTSTFSKIAKPMILLAENIENKYILLTGTSYEEWELGVQEYQLEMQDANGDYKPIANSLQTNYTDSIRTTGEILKQCYRLKAIERSGNSQISYSNVACIDHLPHIFIPDAFSPNNDSLNDRFVIHAIGVREYSITIYNRWGEVVFSGDQGSSPWDGKFKEKFCTEGRYLYTLTSKDCTGQSITKSGYINLLK